jgi:ethanolamine utilization protein EutN
LFLGKITGNLYSTKKNDHLVGHKLMLVKPIDLEGKIIDEKEVLSIDLVDSGIGDTVLVAREGDAVQQVLGHKNAPVNTMIIGVVDSIDYQE